MSHLAARLEENPCGPVSSLQTTIPINSIKKFLNLVDVSLTKDTLSATSQGSFSTEVLAF